MALGDADAVAWLQAEHIFGVSFRPSNLTERAGAMQLSPLMVAVMENEHRIVKWILQRPSGRASVFLGNLNGA